MSNFDKTADKSVIAWKVNGNIWKQLKRQVIEEGRFFFAFIDNKEKIFDYAIRNTDSSGDLARDTIIACAYVSEDGFEYKLHICENGNLWRYYTGNK